jgi:hypothetical protein
MYAFQYALPGTVAAPLPRSLAVEQYIGNVSGTLLLARVADGDPLSGPALSANPLQSYFFDAYRG